MLSRQLLARQTGTKQIIMITDGEPTAHFEPGMATPFFTYPPVQETIDATLARGRCAAPARASASTRSCSTPRATSAFIEKLTKLNRGRAFFTTPETLGDYVLVDFIEQKRATRSARGRRTRLTRRASSDSSSRASAEALAAPRTSPCPTEQDERATERRVAANAAW